LLGYKKYVTSLTEKIVCRGAELAIYLPGALSEIYALLFHDMQLYSNGAVR
jgi:hypothetical protein